LYQKWTKIIIEQAPIIPLFDDKVARFSRKELTGLTLEFIEFKKVKKKNIPIVTNK
jgi:peptide/nickel transport system substrate-binding protein